MCKRYQDATYLPSRKEYKLHVQLHESLEHFHGPRKNSYLRISSEISIHLESCSAWLIIIYYINLLCRQKLTYGVRMYKEIFTRTL